MTCSTSAGSIPARATALRIASAPSVVADSAASAPLKRPNGVRAVERTTDLRAMMTTFRGTESRVLRTRALRADDALVVVARLALELHGDVIDLELVVQRGVDALQQCGRFADPAVVDDDVRGQRVRAGSERPHVQVVNGDHAVETADRLANRRQRGVRRAPIPAARAVASRKIPHDAGDDDRRDEQRERRVDPGRARSAQIDRAADRPPRARPARRRRRAAAPRAG